MEDRQRIRVGITHGDINGVGYEVILKTFADATMLELCTPIVYGSPKVATFHRKSMDIPTNFCIFIITYGRMIEIYLVTSVAPIPMATMTNLSKALFLPLLTTMLSPLLLF